MLADLYVTSCELARALHLFSGKGYSHGSRLGDKGVGTLLVSKGADVLLVCGLGFGFGFGFLGIFQTFSAESGVEESDKSMIRNAKIRRSNF